MARENNKAPRKAEENDGLVKKTIAINRVTKVVKGGRNMRFSVTVVVGDGNGHVGVGLGKAGEVPEAIRKGKEDAMKKLITVKLDEVGSVTHDVTGKHTGASVLLKRSPEGTLWSFPPLSHLSRRALPFSP